MGKVTDMMKKFNDVFFGICLIVTIIVELYLVQIMKSDWLTIGGMAIVICITGYLFTGAAKDRSKKNLESSLESKRLETILMADYLLTKRIAVSIEQALAKEQGEALGEKINDQQIGSISEDDLKKVKLLLENNIKLLEQAGKHSLEMQEEKNNKLVVPLYNDPNKELTRDEIASLFESFGQQ